MAKQPEIKAELGENANVTTVSKRSAEIWKHLPPEERAHWDDVAAKDKQRYMNEKGGIPLHAMNVISYGEDRPVADNSTREGRAQNRRVVVRVLE